MSRVPLADIAHLSEREYRRRVQRAWGEFLGGFEWSHFVTLTFDQPPGVERARRDFRRWLRRTEGLAKRAVMWFYAIELDSSGCRHIHALLAGASGVPAGRLGMVWPHGVAECRTYDANGGAAFYVTKAVTDDLIDYDLDGRLAKARGKHA